MSTTTKNGSAIKEYKDALLAYTAMYDAADTMDELEAAEAFLEAARAKHEAAKRPRRVAAAGMFAAVPRKQAKPNRKARRSAKSEVKAVRDVKFSVKTVKCLGDDMNVLKPENRTLWVGDNLTVMRGLASGSVGLVYADPPFNSKREYNSAVGSAADGASFGDTWRLDDVKVEWAEVQASDNPKLHHVVMAAGLAAGEAMQAYITFMLPRLVECHRLLADTGSMYLHCDDHAAAYLQLAMDAVFGSECRLNTITWKRHYANNAVTSRYGRIADTILFYAKEPKSAVWNQQYGEMSAATRATYCYTDDDGRRYALHPLDAPKAAGSDDSRRFVWRGAQPGPTRVWAYSMEALEEMLAAGEIELGKGGKAKVSGKKSYLEGHAGQKLQSIWTDIQRLGSNAKERTGWATQKPVKLLERIIASSSNPGDLVLDPFAGSGTTLVAAEKLDREWVGIDWDTASERYARSRLQSNIDQAGGLCADPAARVVKVAKPEVQPKASVTPAAVRVPGEYVRSDIRITDTLGGTQRGVVGGREFNVFFSPADNSYTCWLQVGSHTNVKGVGRTRTQAVLDAANSQYACRAS